LSILFDMVYMGNLNSIRLTNQLTFGKPLPPNSNTSNTEIALNSFVSLIMKGYGLIAALGLGERGGAIPKQKTNNQLTSYEIGL
jgi:hypothetical protein